MSSRERLVINVVEYLPESDEVAVIYSVGWKEYHEMKISGSDIKDLLSVFKEAVNSNKKEMF